MLVAYTGLCFFIKTILSGFGVQSMAKINMICPFSGKLCRECPQFRGRHYYLCFYTKYRGYIGEKEEKITKKPSIEKPGRQHASPGSNKWG